MLWAMPLVAQRGTGELPVAALDSTRTEPQSVFERAQMRQQVQAAFARMIGSAIPDPKKEFAGFLAKTGFVVLREQGQPWLRMVENPHLAFLRRLAALHSDPEAPQKLLRLCREEEPERTRKLGSYTVQRVLERLERDGQQPSLGEAARRAIARAVVEELVATASIDAPNQIDETIQAYLAQRGMRGEDLLGYGFSLVESETPGANEWDALRRDARLFCVRFSPRGFTVYRAVRERKDVRSYTTRRWRGEAASLLAEFTSRHNSAGKAWMGISPR